MRAFPLASRHRLSLSPLAVLSLSMGFPSGMGHNPLMWITILGNTDCSQKGLVPIISILTVVLRL